MDYNELMKKRKTPNIIQDIYIHTYIIDRHSGNRFTRKKKKEKKNSITNIVTRGTPRQRGRRSHNVATPGSNATRRGRKKK